MVDATRFWVHGCEPGRVSDGSRLALCQTLSIECPSSIFFWPVYFVIPVPFSLSFFCVFVFFFCSHWSLVDVPLIFFCPADHVPDWQPRILLGMVEARSVNVKKTTKQQNNNNHIPQLSRASISNPCSLEALELFFFVFSVPRPLPALVLAACGSPRQGGSCPRYVRSRTAAALAVASKESRISATYISFLDEAPTHTYPIRGLFIFL